MAVREMYRGVLEKFQSKRAVAREEAAKAKFSEEAQKPIDYISAIYDLHAGKNVPPERMQNAMDALGIEDSEEVFRDLAALDRRIDARRQWAQDKLKPCPTSEEVKAKLREREQRIQQHKEELERLAREQSQMLGRQAGRQSDSQSFHNAMRSDVPAIVTRLRIQIDAGYKKLKLHPHDAAGLATINAERDALHASVQRDELILQEIETALAQLDAKTPITENEGA